MAPSTELERQAAFWAAELAVREKIERLVVLPSRL
jgi:hypothetical protein